MSLLIEWPQIIVIALIVMRTARYAIISASITDNVERIGAFIGTVGHPLVWFGLLYWGGFFTAP